MRYPNTAEFAFRKLEIYFAGKLRQVFQASEIFQIYLKNVCIRIKYFKCFDKNT